MAQPIILESKVVRIEAKQFTGDQESAQDILDWVRDNGGAATFDNGTEFALPSLTIHTLEGLMKAFEGWWVFKGTAGEFYPCRNDVKETKYNEITE